VAQDKIDFAAIDAQSWRLIKKYDSFVSNLEVLGHTKPSPGLPFITSKINLRKNLFNAIRQAIRNLQKQYRSLLYLNDFVTIDENKYLVFEN
jgi:ABC-type phosphate/phosphonate transport system substrate-binding protein